MTKTFTPADLLSLIDINPPYFAFEEVLMEGDSFFANVPVQQPLGNETGPISAAEASRHLAILGVCSCAIANPVKQRHYYLAYKGIYQRFDGDTSKSSSSTGKLTGKAKCISVDRRKAEAETELIDDNGNVIVRLKVFYHVVLDTTFERLYKDHYIAQPDFKIPNPFAQKHDFVSEQLFSDKITCSMGPVPEYYCAGHFPNFPALPVAILVYNLFDMANKLTAHMLSTPELKSTIRKYEIIADNLAFAGDDVNLEVNHQQSPDTNLHEMYAEGVANGNKSIGKIYLQVEATENNTHHYEYANTYPSSMQKTNNIG